jgi:hypothetical protein
MGYIMFLRPEERDILEFLLKPDQLRLKFQHGHLHRAYHLTYVWGKLFLLKVSISPICVRCLQFMP